METGKKIRTVLLNTALFCLIGLTLGCSGENTEDVDSAQKGVKEVVQANIKNWGERSTNVGKYPNKQPDNSNGWWFEVENYNSTLKETVITIGNFKASKLTYNPEKHTLLGGLTASESDTLFSAPGSYPIKILFKDSNATLDVGQFIVK